jgi:hypothetical protein
MGASISEETEEPIIAVADWRGVTTYWPNADSGPDIELSTPRIDFGAVPASADTVVYVHNRGSSILEVVEVVPPADVSVAPDAFSVPPGGVQAVTITVTGPATVRSFLRYTTNDPDEATVRQDVYMNNSTFHQIGSPASDFELLGTDGLYHRLSDHAGEVVLLEFGASW